MIASLHGATAGGGRELAAAARLRVADRTTDGPAKERVIAFLEKWATKVSLA